MLSGLIDRDSIVVAIGDTTLTAAKPSLRFLGDGSLSGSTGVNRMFAQYDIVTACSRSAPPGAR